MPSKPHLRVGVGGGGGWAREGKSQKVRFSSQSPWTAPTSPTKSFLVSTRSQALVLPLSPFSVV